MGSNPTPGARNKPPALYAQFGQWMQNEGYKPATITRYTKIIHTIEKAANLYECDNIKTYVAKADWSDGTKEVACDAYSLFAKSKGFKWERPRYQRTEKLPFIPLEAELDALISGTGPKTSAVLLLLKETACRVGEAWNLKWTDIDFERGIVNIVPEKKSRPRQFKLSNKLCSVLSRQPKANSRVFGGRDLENFRINFQDQRRNLTQKLGNPRLVQITFHTFRHWRATYEYNRTHDILHVMRFLGHKSIQNTLRYTQLVDWKSDDFTCKTAKTLGEASQLIEAGFDYVTELDGVKLFRKRK